MQPKAGDLIAIPSAGRFGVAKVLFCSQYFSQVILIGLFRSTFEELNSIDAALLTEPMDLYYTGSDPIAAGKWPVVGYRELQANEKLLSKRIVAGDVWVEDRHIGAASEQDLAALPKMLTYGARLIEKAIQRFGSG